MAAMKLTNRYEEDPNGPPRAVQAVDASMNVTSGVSNRRIETYIDSASEHATKLVLRHRLQQFGSRIIEDGTARTTREELTLLRYLDYLNEHTAQEAPRLANVAENLTNHYANLAHQGVEESLKILIDRTGETLREDFREPPVRQVHQKQGFFGRLFAPRGENDDFFEP